MSRRKEANRAEAIVKGVGATVLLLVLLIMVYALPRILKGQNTDEMLRTMLRMIMIIALLAGAVVVIGLIVWIKVLKGKNKRDDF